MYLFIMYCKNSISKGEKLSVCIKLITVLQLRSFYNVMMKIVCVYIYNIYNMLQTIFKLQAHYKMVWTILKQASPF